MALWRRTQPEELPPVEEAVMPEKEVPVEEETVVAPVDPAEQAVYPFPQDEQPDPQTGWGDGPPPTSLPGDNVEG